MTTSASFDFFNFDNCFQRTKTFKEAKSATMNIFEKKSFLFKSFV